MNSISGKISLLIAFSLAGTSVVTGSILSEKLGSFTIAAASLGIVLLCLVPFYMSRIVETIRHLSVIDRKMLLLQAVFGIFLFRTFLLFGVRMTSTAEAGILTGATPAITAMLAFLFLRESLSRKAVQGIGCTVAGIVLLQGMNLISVSFSAQHFWGNVLILCAAASESTFNVIARKHGKSKQYSNLQIHPMVQMLLVAMVAFALCVIPALLEHPLASMRTIGWKEWSALAWYGLIVTAVAFAFFFTGVKRCDAYTTAAFSGMMPLTAMLLSILLLQEKIGMVQWAGGVLIICGMLLIGGRRRSGINAKRPSGTV